MNPPSAGGWPWIVEVRTGDLMSAGVEALVVPTSTSGEMGEGIGRAVRQMAGAEVEKQARGMGKGRPQPIPVGSVRHTSGHRLAMQGIRHLIHAAVIERVGQRSSRANVRQATAAALNLAEQMGLVGIAIPALGASAKVRYGDAAVEILGALGDHGVHHPDSRLRKVVLIDRNPRFADAVTALLTGTARPEEPDDEGADDDADR